MAVALVCPFCGFSKKTPEEMIPERARWAICPRCRQKFELSPLERGSGPLVGGMGVEPPYDGAEQSETASEGREAPWEGLSENGFVRGAWQTSKAVLFSPAAFFRGLKVNGGLKEPLAFGLLMGAVGSMLGLFWPVMMVSGGLFPLGGAVLLGQVGPGLIFLILLVVVPICVTVGMFLYSGILHLLLLVTRAGRNGFEATFRVVAYSQATQMWELVPVVGSWIGGIWRLVVQVIGLREIHGVSYARVIIAFLLPIILLAVLIVTVVIPFIMLLAR